MERKIKLSRRGNAQMVRLPKGFELPGDTVMVRKVGNAIWLEAPPTANADTGIPESFGMQNPIDTKALTAEPTRPSRDLLEVLRTLEPIDEAWPEIDDPPPEPVEL